jgi:hypothetical protein
MRPVDGRSRGDQPPTAAIPLRVRNPIPERKYARIGNSKDGDSANSATPDEGLGDYKRRAAQATAGEGVNIPLLVSTTRADTNEPLPNTMENTEAIVSPPDNMHMSGRLQVGHRPGRLDSNGNLEIHSSEMESKGPGLPTPARALPTHALHDQNLASE